MVSSFFNKVILLLNQNSIVQPYLCSHLYTVCGYNYASKLSLCWYPGPQNESMRLKSFPFVSFSTSFGYLSKNILQMSLCFVFTDSQSILSPCLSDFKFSTTPSKSSISSSVQLKTSHKLNFFFVSSSSVDCSDLLLAVAILQLPAKRTFYNFVPFRFCHVLHLYPIIGGTAVNRICFIPASCEHLSTRNRIMPVPGQWCRFQIISALCELGLEVSAKFVKFILYNTFTIFGKIVKTTF